MDRSGTFQPAPVRRQLFAWRSRGRAAGTGEPFGSEAANGLNTVSLRGPEIRAEYFVADVVRRHASLHKLCANMVHEGQRSAGEDVEVIRQWNVR